MSLCENLIENFNFHLISTEKCISEELDKCQKNALMCLQCFTNSEKHWDKEKQATEKQLQTIKEDITEQKKAIEGQERKVQELTKLLSGIQEATECAHLEEKEFKTLLQTLERSLEKKKTDIEAKEKSSQEEAIECQKASSYFQQRLALKIKRSRDDWLTFIFTSIDPNDAERKFTFALKVNERNLFEVPGCDPQVPGLSELVEDLNRNNNLLEFVYVMRQRFKALV
ncbi:kinetochore protein Spc25-like [Limulus polyphemus]|uniref:Kinetochore protein SPC25 n=1 Tax=Limulus polyphemus TaxID=6850 RepID=A0ABM1S9T1_LIMPO|nr:kinetochore protein Spc25-like [Limulus polyphemus]